MFYSQKRLKMQNKEKPIKQQYQELQITKWLKSLEEKGETINFTELIVMLFDQSREEEKTRLATEITNTLTEASSLLGVTKRSYYRRATKYGIESKKSTVIIESES